MQNWRALVETDRRLIVDDAGRSIFKVDRRAFTDPEILDVERRLIFDRCWLYAGHETEIPEKGNFITRDVGGRPVIIVRDRAGEPRIFLNSCAHRGNVVCRERSGSAEAFRCFYHGWVYSLDGKLQGLPGPDAYGPGFDRDLMGLTSVPRFANYRGLLFLNFDVSAVGLEEYLGNARAYLDLFLDFGGEDLYIAPGAQAYSMRANWKLLVENSFDAYHGVSTHRRYFGQFLPDMGLDPKGWVNWRGDDGGRAVALGNGHALVERSLGSGPLAKAESELAEIRARLVDRYGPERASLIADYSRNLLIFPNLIFISTWRTMRTFFPISPSYMEVNAWALLPKHESPSLRRLRLDNFLSFLGPGGFGTPDDVAALEGCQRGFDTARELRWSDVSRGMARASRVDDELQMRAFWRYWNALVNGRMGPTECGDRVPVRAGVE
jgi:p-cumate 2,3-dioxygenase alpha subunit